MSAAEGAVEAACGQAAEGSVPEELDEFGRDAGLEKRMEASRRSSKREARRQAQRAHAAQRHQVPCLRRQQHILFSCAVLERSRLSAPPGGSCSGPGMPRRAGRYLLLHLPPQPT